MYLQHRRGRLNRPRVKRKELAGEEGEGHLEETEVHDFMEGGATQL